MHIEKRFNDSCGCCLWKGELVRNGDKIVSELKRSSSDSSIYQQFYLKVKKIDRTPRSLELFLLYSSVLNRTGVPNSKHGPGLGKTHHGSGLCF